LKRLEDNRKKTDEEIEVKRSVLYKLEGKLEAIKEALVKRKEAQGNTDHELARLVKGIEE
jgi:hypothetical protein